MGRLERQANRGYGDGWEGGEDSWSVLYWIKPCGGSWRRVGLELMELDVGFDESEPIDARSAEFLDSVDGGNGRRSRRRRKRGSWMLAYPAPRG